jgi:hypothetical protein
LENWISMELHAMRSRPDQSAQNVEAALVNWKLEVVQRGYQYLRSFKPGVAPLLQDGIL